MIPLFLGLSAGNLLLLAGAFMLGWVTANGGVATSVTGASTSTAQLPSDYYTYHLLLGTGAGLMTALTHMTVFTYFMATTKWLGAATDKGGFDPRKMNEPAQANKVRAMIVAMTAVIVTIITMMAGAGADPVFRPLWPVQVHLALGVVCLVVNLLCAMAEFRLIRQQGELMDQALAILNEPAGQSVGQV